MSDTNTSADDRSSTFRPLEGAQAEHYSGEVLLVSAYAALFVILVLWVVGIWRKARAMESRIDDLEREIDKAGAREARDADARK
jgi:hypothetical protein